MTTTNTTLVITLDDGTTAPMTPPRELGEAFAAIITEALSWDEQKRNNINAIADDDLIDLTDEIDIVNFALIEADLGWSCTFGDSDDDDALAALPYVTTLSDKWSEGAAAVASAVLARDLGLVSEMTFNAITGWWLAAGLTLPEPYAHAPEWAIDLSHALNRAKVINHQRYGTQGWPLATLI